MDNLADAPANYLLPRLSGRAQGSLVGLCDYPIRRGQQYRIGYLLKELGSRLMMCLFI